MKILLKLSLITISCTSFFLGADVTKITSMNQLDSLIASTKSLVMKFYADDCPPCKSFAPIYKQISQDTLFGSVAFVEINTQQCPDIALRFRVRSIPTLLFIQDQKVLGTRTGSLSAVQLKDILKNYFSLQNH